MKNKLFRWLSVGSTFGLILQMILPANFALAQATSIGSLRSWEDVITGSSADLHFSFSAAGYFRFDYGTAPESYTSSSSTVTLTNTSYPYYNIMVSGLAAGATYYYRLASKTLNGTEWAYTSGSSFTTTAADTTPPTVSGVYANNVTDSGASITFILSETGYITIQYGPNNTFTSSTQEYSISAGGTSTTGLPGLTGGTTYSYRIVTRDSAGNSGTSDTYTFTTLSSLPSAPTGLSTSGSSETTIGIYWTDNSTNETEFRIERRLNSGAWSQTGTVGANITTYTDSISGAGTYEYQVKACNSSGCSAESNIVSRTMAASAPAAPTNLSASYGSSGTSVNVSWTDNSTDEWGFRLNRRVKGTTSWFGLASVFNNYPSVTSVSYTDTYQLVTGTTYEYVVRSYNTYESGDSNIVTAAPPGTATTGAPTISGAHVMIAGAATTQLMWTCDQSCYGQVEYSTSPTYGGGFFMPWTTALSSSPTVDLSGLTANTTYYTRLYAKNTSGAVSTPVSFSFTTSASGGATTDTTAPTVSAVAASGVTAVSASIAFTLNESGWGKVEYGIGGNYGYVSSDIAASPNIPASIPLTGLSSSATYNYRVVGRDSANNNATSGSYWFTTTSGSTAATTTPSATGTAGIKVIVKDPWGGLVSGSNVSVSNSSTGGSSWANGYTGADGSYTFSGLASGSYNIGVSAPSNRTDLGYVTSYPASLASGITMTIDVTLPRSTTTTPTATSTPPIIGTAGIRITVKDTTGAVVSGANVSISNAQTGGSSWASGYTGADGSYTATNLVSGSHNIGVSAPSSRTDLGYLTSYPVTLVSGTSITQEVTLPRSTTTTPPPTNDTTAPVISGVHIMDNNSTRTQVMWGTDDQSYGQVEYGETTAYGKSTSWSATYSYSPTIDITGLSIGKLYHYRVRAKNQAGLETTSGDYTFTAGSSTTPTPTIFTVEPARSYPQSGASEVPLSNLKIHIEFSKSVDPNTVSGADLFFGFLGSTDGTSLSGSLDVFSNGFNFIPSQPLKSGASYNFIVRSTIWAQTGEQLAGDYSITFTTAKEGTVAGQGTIKGTIKDGSGQPVSGAYVSLRAGGAYATYTSSYYGGGSSSGFGYNQTTQTTTYGEYTFTNLAAGTYTIEAYPPSGGGGVDRPAPQAVTIAANETVTRDFTFASSGRFIKGTVKFSDGSPVTDAEVSAYKREGGGWVSSPTGESGAYTLAVGSGSWMVSIRPRYAPVPYPAPYVPGTIAYTPPPAPPTPNWVYTNPPQEVYIDTESKVVDFLVPRQSSSTSVSGTLERADGEPLSDGVATVRFIGQGGFSVSTAVPAGGRFSTPINPGGYKVYVDLTDSNLSSPDFPPISVSPGEQKDIGVIRLYGASASISGRVTTPDGKGIPRVKVGGWKMNSSDNSSASTDEKGEYVLKVSSGEWTVGIMPTPDQPYTTTAPPQVVRVKGGRVSGINFVLAASDGIVNGVVTDESGNILSDFYGFVRVGSKGGSRLPGGAPVERGQFTLRLPAGSYILYMELPPNAGYGWPAPVPITVSTGESVKVAMKMATSVSGAVIGYLVDQAGNKITNAPFKVFASGEGGGWYSAITDEAIGYYKLKLPAGTWFIGYELAGEENSYERIGGRKKKVKVGAGEIVSLDLEVVRSSGKITGVIRDDEGAGVANVWIAIASSQFGTFSRATAVSWRYLNGVNSDENGNFALNVPPGIYYVRAFVPPSLNFINPEEQKVGVSAGEEETVELILRARETTISGKTTIAGIPNWAFVWAWSDTGGYTESAADDSGNYKLKVSSGDTWHVAAMAEIKRETFKASEVELVVTRPGNYPLSLDLTPLGVKLPEPVTVSTEADQMTVAENAAGSKLVVPANAAGTEGTLNVSITPQVLTPSQGADRVIGFGYEMEVRTPTGQEINTFNSELTVSIPYDPLELGRLNLSPTDLTLRFWDETSSTWQMIGNAVVDETNHVVTGSVAHLTRFALVAATDTEPPSAPGQVKARVAGDGVVITWQKPKDKDLKYVKVYRSAKAGVLGEVVANNLTAATYKDSGMARGAAYYYLVRAVDAAGNESINTAAVKAAVTGKGMLGKKATRGISAVKEKQKLEGTITDINLAASTLEIKNKAGKKVIVSFSPTLQVDKDGKKVSASTLKNGNTITAEAAKDGTALTLLSAKAGAVKVKIKGKVKGAATVGARGKVTLKVSDVQGKVEGASIKRGQETNVVIQGGYLLSNGRAVPVEHLLTQGDVIVEGVLEDGGVTVTRITTGK